MAKQDKEVQKIQKEFLPYGVRIAQLSHDLHMIGAHQAAREVMKAADVFHEDVERIIDTRKKKKTKKTKTDWVQVPRNTNPRDVVKGSRTIALYKKEAEERKKK